MDTDYDDKPLAIRPSTPMPGSPAGLASLTASQETTKPSEGMRAEMFKRAMQAAEQEPPGGIRPLKALGVPVAGPMGATAKEAQQEQPTAQQIAFGAYRAGQAKGMQDGLVMGLAAAGGLALAYFGYSWVTSTVSRNVGAAKCAVLPKNPID